MDDFDLLKLKESEYKYVKEWQITLMARNHIGPAQTLIFIWILKPLHKHLLFTNETFSFLKLLKMTIPWHTLNLMMGTVVKIFALCWVVMVLGPLLWSTSMVEVINISSLYYTI